MSSPVEVLNDALVDGGLVKYYWKAPGYSVALLRALENSGYRLCRVGRQIRAKRRLKVSADMVDAASRVLRDRLRGDLGEWGAAEIARLVLEAGLAVPLDDDIELVDRQ